MRPEIQFVLASVGMSLIVAYVGWLRYRVWAFRQDLFGIRDKTWDDMHEAGTLSDPSHREFREGVNALIRVAPSLSVLTVYKLIISVDSFKNTLPVPDAGLVAIQDAKLKVFVRVIRYLFAETASGWFLIVFLTAFSMYQQTLAAITERLQFLFDSHVFQNLTSSSRPEVRKIMENV